MIYSSWRTMNEYGEPAVVYWLDPPEAPQRMGVMVVDGQNIAGQGKAETVSLALGMMRDAIPKLDADGRWEQEIKQLIADYQASLDRGACKGDAGEGLLRLVVMNLTQVCERASAPPAEGR